MKALSLTQPWATLVAIGAKQFETRSWSTKYRGPLAIHASKVFPSWAKELSEQPEFHSALRPNGQYVYPELTLGVIVCVTTLENCIPVEQIRDELSHKENTFGDYSDGRFAWKLGPIIKQFGIAEFPIKGHLGLWHIPEMEIEG